MKVITDSTSELSCLSSSDFQSVLIDSVTREVDYDLAGLNYNIITFSQCGSISLPQDSCGWSSLTATGEGELRRTDIRLSVESDKDGS